MYENGEMDAAGRSGNVRADHDRAMGMAVPLGYGTPKLAEPTPSSSGWGYTPNTYSGTTDAPTTQYASTSTYSGTGSSSIPQDYYQTDYSQSSGAASGGGSSIGRFIVGLFKVIVALSFIGLVVIIATSGNTTSTVTRQSDSSKAAAPNFNRKVWNWHKLSKRMVSVPAGDKEGLLNVRDGAGKQYDSIVKLKHGQIVKLLGDEQKVGTATWVKINYGEGTGWVNSQFLVQP